jgi:3-methylcrotonyl-CoA carboxylase alpha subunit
MEMNTRLQVEHPVTEEITGQDLVEWQLRVASGEPLPKRQDELAIDGWAMEARLYAEDPAKGFLPSIGTLDTFDLGEGVRIDTGVTQGAAISPFYDPMIAKMIAHGATRDAARERLAAALDDTAIWPLKTNAGFLVKALEHPDFAAARLDTGLIGREGDALMPPGRPDDEAIADAARALTQGGALAGFRLNAPLRTAAGFLLDGEPVTIDLDPRDGADSEPADDVLIAQGGQVWRLSPWRAGSAGSADAADGAILSPMPGRIIAVAVEADQAVTKGQKLLTLEAMKMEHSLVAPFDGTVAELNAEEGGQVSEGALLARIDRPAAS